MMELLQQQQQQQQPRCGCCLKIILASLVVAVLAGIGVVVYVTCFKKPGSEESVPGDTVATVESVSAKSSALVPGPKVPAPAVPAPVSILAPTPVVPVPVSIPAPAPTPASPVPLPEVPTPAAQQEEQFDKDMRRVGDGVDLAFRAAGGFLDVVDQVQDIKGKRQTRKEREAEAKANARLARKGK